MKQRGSISKGSVEPLLQQAAEAWNRQDYEKSIELLERAQSRDPSNPSVLLDLGRAYGMRYDYAKAEDYLEMAIRASPRRTETIVAAGRRCQEFASDQMAWRYFERAAEQPDASAEVFVALAELHERRNQLDKATELVDRALKLDARHPLGRLVRARLERLAGQWSEAEQRVRALLGSNEGDAWLRARAWYELGGILDRQGLYHEAMAAFLEAKALLRPESASPLKILQSNQARVREMEQTISAEVLERWHKAGDALKSSRRLAMLLGHPRSGTTLLEQVLDAHPEIVSAEETHILFNEACLPLRRNFPQNAPVLEVLESAPASMLQQSRENYFRFTELFTGKPLGDKLLVDKNPALNSLIPSITRIFPEVKFLIALRDPRDVCLSCFMQPLILNPGSSAYLSLEGTVTQYVSSMGFWRTMASRLRNPWIEIRYEDVVADLETSSRRVLTFLGVEWSADVLRFYEHARNKIVLSPSYAEVTRPVFKSAIGRWRNYQTYLEPYLKALEPFIRSYGYE
jgi:tetratricopeptide (TPR) repeat protein